MFNFFQKKPTGTKLTFKVDGMHCTSCSLNIDGELEDLPGVISASTSYAKGVTNVVFDPEKVQEAQLIKAIQGLGYSAHS